MGQPAAEHWSIELQPNELTRDGSFYVNHWPYRVEVTPDALRVLPPRTPWLGWTTMTIVLLSVYLGFWWLFGIIERQRGEPFPRYTWPIIVLCGILSVGGPVVGHLLVQWRLKRRGVPFAFDRQTRRVRILDGRHAFDADDVVAVQSLTEWSRPPTRQGALGGRGSCLTDLSLIVRRPDGKRERHFLLGWLDGRAHCLDWITQPIADITGLPVVRCYRSGWNKTGEMLIERVEPKLKRE